MSKFKIGDRVRRKHLPNNAMACKIGDELEVIEPRQGESEIGYFTARYSDDGWDICLESDFELVSTNPLIENDKLMSKPEYWYIRLTEKNRQDVRRYLHDCYGKDWRTVVENFNYAGYDGSNSDRGGNGTELWDSPDDFKNDAVEITYDQFKQWFLNEGSSVDTVDLDNFWIRSDINDPRWWDYIQYIRERFDKPESFKGTTVKHCYTIVGGNYYYANAYPRPETLKEITLDQFFNHINNKSGESPQIKKDEVQKFNQSGSGDYPKRATRRAKPKRRVAIGSIPHQNEIRGKISKRKIAKGEVSFSTIRR